MKEKFRKSQGGGGMACTKTRDENWVSYNEKPIEQEKIITKFVIFSPL